MTEIAEFVSSSEAKLSEWGRFLFAATCLQRIMPVYMGYCQREEADPQFYDWLELVWQVLAGVEEVSEEELLAYEEEGLEELPSGGGPGVQSVALGVLQLLAELRGKRLAVVACSQMNLTEIDTWLLNDQGLSLDEAEEHPLVKEEEGRQRRDIVEILAIGEPGVNEKSKVVEQFKSRAIREELVYLVRSGDA